MNLPGYIKSQKKLKDGAEIFFPETRFYSYKQHEYETFIDKYGRSREVIINTEWVDYEFSDEDIIIENHNNLEFISHKKISFDEVKFQLNLNKYIVLRRQPFPSDYVIIKNLISDLINQDPTYSNLTDLKYKYRNNNPWVESGYFPLFETCYSSGLNCRHKVENYIPDRVFFNYPDRAMALERIDDFCKEVVFGNIDYVNIKDVDLVKFINDRFSKRIKFQQYFNLKTHLINI